MSFICENFRKLHFINPILCEVKVLCYQYYTSPLKREKISEQQVNPKVLSVANSCHYNENFKNGKHRL